MMRFLGKSLATLALVTAAFSFGGAPACAQSTLAYIDGDGQWSWVDVSPGGATFARKAAENIGGIFNVTYVDVEESTGEGFDDSELGEARRATMAAVLSYMAAVLDVPGTADLLVQASQTDGEGGLASAGPFLIPESGFQGGLVYEHLTTGVDPVPTALDGVVTVDFGYRWNSETDSPSAREHDLFTTLLHEVTHALGLLSVTASDARSAVLNEGGSGLFSIYDSFLMRQSTEMPLFLEGGAFNADGDDVASGDVVFAGERARAELGEYPRVFAPSPFLEGSSIGHWSSSNGFNSIMLPALGPGIERRRYRSWELQVLADIGYEVTEEPGLVEYEAGAPPDPSLGPAVPDTPIDDPDGSEDRPVRPSAIGAEGCSVGPSTSGSSAWVLVALWALTVLRRRRVTENRRA